ncbi:glycosyltransferase family 4 protein [Streptosporangium sp. NPDC050280]|uniref:glycosyltransferase family 4 protein n=1 Tax=unclassified Streptosporangium TaxID=2632669 RepID=UPI003448215D
MRLTIDTAVQFFPRGGSAQVIRYLAADLTGRGHTCRILCGSLGQPGQFSHAETFYQNLPVTAMDYTPAADAYARGGSAMDGQAAPFHPSFEDRGPDAPDRMFTAVTAPTTAHLVNAWAQHLISRRSQRPDVVHVHHLSHLQAAVARAYPGIPRVTTFHGTDLKLLDQAQQHTRLAARTGVSLEQLARACRHPDPGARHDALEQLLPRELEAALRERVHALDWRHWSHADSWVALMNAYARQAGRIVTVSTSDQAEVERLLGLPAPQVTVIGNGVDTTRFVPQHLTVGQKLALLRHWLVDDPQGWAPGQMPGSIRYTDEDLAAMLTPDGQLRPIILWIGRYQQVKRLNVLLEAFATTIKETSPAPILLLWGGYPGENEGEHPYEAARRLGIDRHVYLIGWRGHDELPAGLNCADLMAAPAVNESFGMVYIEAAACGVPPIATSTGGPATLITARGPQADGWLVAPDDVADLAAALTSALADPAERTRRSANGVDHVRRDYAWPRVADRYQQVYQEVMQQQPKA